MQSVPSVWWETFALVISEAWMFGKPVIASDVGAMSERISDDLDGLLFNMGDAADLARVMQRACQETGLWIVCMLHCRSSCNARRWSNNFKVVYAAKPSVHPSVWFHHDER